MSTPKDGTMWGPLLPGWFKIPSNYSYITNPSEIGVVFTNLAVVRAPHIVAYTIFNGDFYD